MSGEQYITKASLVSDLEMSVVVFPGTELVLRDYRSEALRKGLTLVELFGIRHGHKLDSDEAVRKAIHAAQMRRRDDMAAFFRAGILRPERVTTSDDYLTPQTSGSTAAVANFYRETIARLGGPEPPRHPQDQIIDALFSEDAITHLMKEQIEAYYESKLKKGEKYVFFWGRKSGEISGQGPWLDTNETMLAQMMVVIRRNDPKRKLVLIGDPVRLPPSVDGEVVPHFDVTLVQYWDHDFPGKRDATAQLYFLRIIIALNPDSVSIGTNSGILELPHLMGMKTVYLENDHLHKRKGLRWQLLAANYGPSENPADLGSYEQILQSLRLQPKRNARKIEKYVEKVRAIETRKVDLLNIIRPGLQRFSTSTATELWSSRKALFDEIRPWLTAPLVIPIKLAPLAPRGNPKSQNQFLVHLIQAAATSPDEPAPLGQAAPAWRLFHEVKREWVLLRGTPFCGRFDLQSQALRAMRLCMETQHGLRQEELQRFWEVFNYTYLGPKKSDAPSAPSWKAAYRGWLKDTEDIWAYVLSRQA
ncbi:MULTISPECIES: hypothetical protein [unclassified Variovorax]|jgi:hypothetical protein|uniref:hypothetical protein n=1 Tax=unclassified Variovorax TaxID=663243 RepID=UPI000F7E7281|nr:MULTISPECIES: hypothetical protein [unclassified Variovorax]RSZ32754.1 hypothetical protein EJO70_29815 [Variovorax sp. 553]RSZ33009.1 hypothetical protein EJO71_29270 [Variovorax sp. 679]